MKRRTSDRRGPQEIKSDGFNLYGTYERHPSNNINPLFLKGHYPKMEGVKKNG